MVSCWLLCVGGPHREADTQAACPDCSLQSLFQAQWREAQGVSTDHWGREAALGRGLGTPQLDHFAQQSSHVP